MTHFSTEVLDRAAELIAADPRLPALRDALFALEAQGEQAGWDAPANEATIFAIERNRGTGTVRARRSELINEGFQLAIEGVDGDPGAALLGLAQRFDQVSRVIGPVTERGQIEFYGFALRTEAWSTGMQPDDETAAEARAYAERHALHEYPGRIEVRQVYLAGRDGLSWWVIRVRGGEPELMVALPEGTVFGTAGRIPAALARMTNAYTGSHAPVPGLS